MDRVTFYGIVPELMGNAPAGGHEPQMHNELHLGPNVRLSGHNGMAHIESAVLAEEFAQVCLPRLQKRYGADTTLRVVECQASGNKQLLERIKRDSEIIRKRIDTGNLAPNKPV